MAKPGKIGHEPEHLVVLERKYSKTDGSLSYNTGTNMNDIQMTKSEQ